MITYVPFLKAKSNEIVAVGELTPEVRAAICPFFDYPRKLGVDEATFKTGVEKMVRSVEKHLGLNDEFYFDNYDLGDTFGVDGKHNYRVLLESLAGFPVIPVVSVDRSAEHIAAVLDLKAEGEIQSDVIAFRITPDNFEEYSLIEDDIASELAPVFAAFGVVDLIFDCRVCNKLHPNTIAEEVRRFSEEFCAAYHVRRVVLTGSSIPGSVREILSVQTERTIHRHELDIYQAAKAIHNHAELTFGDYTTVSPLYTDLDLAPEILYNVMTAKFTYTLNSSHFFIRGGGLKTQGRGQYFQMARQLCSKPFFRGANFSNGDKYFHQKSRRIGNNCAPNTVIKPSVNAHISYMVLNATP